MTKQDVKRQVPRCCNDTTPYCFLYSKPDWTSKTHDGAKEDMPSPCVDPGRYAQDTSAWD